MFRFIERQTAGNSNLICENESFREVFLEGLEKVIKYSKNSGPFSHFVITDGFKGPVVWETVPADVFNKRLTKDSGILYE